MAENTNIDELLNKAKDHGIELTEDQLIGIAGGNDATTLQALGIVGTGFAALFKMFDEIKKAKDSGQTIEEFIVSMGGEVTPELVKGVKTFWDLA